MKAVISRFAAITTLLLLLFFSFPGTAAALTTSEDSAALTARAKIINMLPEKIEDNSFGLGFKLRRQFAEAIVLNGDYKGQQIVIENTIDEQMAYNLQISKGDEVFVTFELGEAGEITAAYVYEIVRQKYVAWMVAIFISLLALIGGIKGLKSILALLLTGFAVVKVLLPLVLRGYNPILVAVGVGAAVTAVTLLIISGVSKKTLSAIIGTTGGIITAGLLAFAFGSLAKLTGLSEHETQMLMYIPQGVAFDFRGMLFAGIIIGALGAVMDVGMSIASAMYEIESTKPDIDGRDLMRSGMNVGRDLMGTMSNTLILAYTGGALQLMLLFTAYQVPFLEIVNMDMIAAEIIRALAGSIGLICTIPLTVIVAGTIGRRLREAGKPSSADFGLYR